MKEQNITVYHYVGEHGVSAKICGTASEWSVTSKPDSSVEKDIMPLYFQAVQMKKDNLPFVTSREIQHLLYICPYAQDKNEFYSYLHLLGKDKMHQLSKEFSTLYGNKR